MKRKEKKKVNFSQKNSHGKKWLIKHSQSIKVALVYDRVNKWGGAERVLLALHKIFPNAPLYTSVYNQKKAPWAKNFNIKTSFLQNFPFAKTYHQVYAPLMSLAFGSFRFDGFDVVISVTSESAKAVRVKDTAKHICLCLTPTRYLWSGYEEYFPTATLRYIIRPFIQVFRFLDKKSAQNPHEFITISKEVQKRIKTYYGRESRVIYPPLMLDCGRSQVASRKSKSITKKRTTNDERLTTKNYFLVVSRLSRLTPYKRIDIAIQAATKLKLPLVVVGQGNQKYFKKFAGPTVQFVNNVSDEELIMYYKNAKALIFPGKEDFGLVMVEALSVGTPVIAYGAGGALEIVTAGVTGEFFRRQSVDSLVSVLKNFDEKRYNSKSCKENSKRFSFSYFEKSLKEYILKVITI